MERQVQHQRVRMCDDIVNHNRFEVVQFRILLIPISDVGIDLSIEQEMNKGK
jgi:hypothetical protein